MTTFPSVQWFEAVGERVADERERFKRLGYMDATVGVKIGRNGATKAYVLEFGGYGVRRVREVDDPVDLADFTIEGGLDDWKNMIRNIQDHGEPDLAHTLNRLTMAGTPMQVVAKDQLQIDLFYRFNQSIQAFFNESAHVATEFEN
jgi:hypothetical protein